MGEGEGEGQLLGEREHCREDVLQDCNSYIKVRRQVDQEAGGSGGAGGAGLRHNRIQT